MKRRSLTSMERPPTLYKLLWVEEGHKLLWVEEGHKLLWVEEGRMAESMSVRLPYAVGVQLRRLADHYNTPITGVLADLIKRESKACDIPLADALDIIPIEENRFILDIFGLRLPTLQRFQTQNFANDLKRIAERGGALSQSDADVEIQRRGTGVIVLSPDGKVSMSTDNARKIAIDILRHVV